MASKAGGRNDQEFEEDWKFFERFIHDVLVYTLTKCGLPESSLPTTDCSENIYRRTDFLKIAGASVLRISLVMRDKWKLMFKSRSNSGWFNYKDIPKFMVEVVKCYRSSRTYFAQSVVEILLALCNEILLYFHLEKIDIDFSDLIVLISGHIVCVTGLNRNDPEKFEKFFDTFDDISGYTEWIADFISTFAIPYGLRNDVSDRFFERIRKKFKDDTRKMTDSFRFLPDDLFSAITDERSENLSKLTSIPSHSKSLEPPKLPRDSEMDAVGEKTSLGNVSTCTDNVSELLSENKRSNFDISSEIGIEQDLEKTSLDVKETSQETQGAKLKRKKSKKVKGISEKKVSENLAESTSIPSDSKSLESPKLPTDSEMGALGSGSTGTENISEHLSQNEIKLEQRVAAEGSKSLAEMISISNDSESLEPQNLPTVSEIGSKGIKKSIGSLSPCTENVSEHLAENDQSSEISSEVAIEQDLGKPSLVAQ